VDRCLVIRILINFIPRVILEDLLFVFGEVTIT